MTPARYDFPLRKGDTPSAGVILSGRNILTQEVVGLPREGQTVSWRVDWPSGSMTKTTAPGGGLTVDARTRVISYPLTPSDIETIPAGTSVPYAIQVIDGDNHATTYLVGAFVVIDATA